MLGTHLYKTRSYCHTVSNVVENCQITDGEKTIVFADKNGGNETVHKLRDIMVALDGA